MKTTRAWMCSMAALPLIAGCSGGGSEKADADVTADESPSTGGSGCGKGEFKNDGESVVLCGKGGECDPGDLTIDKLRGYTTFRLDMNIQVNGETDLSALNCLESVGGLTIAEGTALTRLDGLKNLKKASSVVILDMPKLTSLAGLDSLVETNQITVNFNDAMTSLDGLPPGSRTLRLYVTGNDALADIEGLANLTVEDRIVFERNTALSQCAVDAYAASFPTAKPTSSGNLAEACP